MPWIRRDSERHTYGDYVEWSAEFGQELIDGVAWVREPPSPDWRHQEILGELLFQLRTAAEGKAWHVFAAPFDVRLPKSNELDGEIDTVVQPDLLIVCDTQRLDGGGIRGAPDWLAEVLSPSTASYDRKKKIPVYERAGVPEVWLVDPADRTLTIYRLKDGRYVPPTLTKLSGQTALTTLPGVHIDWDLLISRLLP